MTGRNKGSEYEEDGAPEFFSMKFSKAKICRSVLRLRFTLG